MSLETLKSKFSFTREAVLLAVTVVGVGFSVLNFYFLSQLRPITARIEQVEARTTKIEETRVKLAERDDIESLSVHLNQRLDDIKGEIQEVSQRLDRFVLK